MHQSGQAPKANSSRPFNNHPNQRRQPSKTKSRSVRTHARTQPCSARTAPSHGTAARLSLSLEPPSVLLYIPFHRPCPSLFPAQAATRNLDRFHHRNAAKLLRTPLAFPATRATKQRIAAPPSARGGGEPIHGRRRPSRWSPSTHTTTFAARVHRLGS
jgi:hypothetical protein